MLLGFRQDQASRNRKLSYAQAEEIRRKHKEDGSTQMALAKEFGVSRSVVQSILARRSYTNKDLKTFPKRDKIT
jgi:DNA-binding transcriptional regulator LsrR (DeoR family)